MAQSQGERLSTGGPLDWLADRIIRHRWLSFFALAAMTTVAAIGHYDPYLLLPDTTPSQPTFFPSRRPSSAERPPANISPVQVAAGDVIVVAESDHFFTFEGAQSIRDAVAAIESLPQVRSVFWMDEAPVLNIFGLPEPILPKGHASEARFDAAKKRALDHPLIVGQLLSPDAKTLLLMVRLDWLFINQDSDCTDALRNAAVRATSKYEDTLIGFRVTGQVPIRISRAASNRANEVKFQLIGYSLALVIAFILFRGISAVLIVAMAPTFGVFWTLGILHFMGLDDNPFNPVIVPVLLCMIGFTDGVHMMVQIRRHCAAGMTTTQAARASIRDVGVACWLTSLTTAIGFGSLALAHHEIVREFGYCCVIGVLMTFFAVITVIPLACSSRLGSRVQVGQKENLVDRHFSFFARVIDYVSSRSRVLAAAAMISTIVLAIMTLQLRPDERLTSNLAQNSEPARALAHVDRAFGGMETAEVVISWNDSVPSSDGEIATVVQQVDAALRFEPLIGHPLSIHGLLQALPGDGEPATRMSMLELLPPELKRTFYTPEYREATVQFRLQDLGIARYGPVFERVEESLATIQESHPAFQLQLSGSAVRRWKNLYRIIVDLAYSLGTAIVIIFFVLTIVYRSIRLGLISTIPNLFPLAATGALLWGFGQNLEIVSVCAFTVCLGIAVDDTIHFLTRYRERLLEGDEQRPAIKNAFVGVGTALVMTTIVLVIGFSSALLSDARDHRIFAAMGIMTITSALFADLVFLPALLLRYPPKVRVLKLRSSGNPTR